MKSATFALAMAMTAMLAACATPPPPAPRADHLFHDELFAAPTEPISARDLFAVSDPMQRFLATELGTPLTSLTPFKSLGAQASLIDALQRKSKLRLEYDSTMTRNAAQAFEARSGNCLSLVVMTAAFAKALGLQVRFQSAYLEEAWSRNGDLLLRSGHVNVTLGPRIWDRTTPLAQTLMVDFLPPEQLRNLRTRDISEATVVAMYMNNKAVEAMVKGQLDNAYAWASAAVRESAEFHGSKNTLGLIYARHGNLPQAALAYAAAVDAEPTNTRALANLADAYMRLGRTSDAEALYKKLAVLEPEPPFYYFDLGQAALQRNDFRTARDMFAREVARADYSSEFHYWLGVASFKLGDLPQATKHLTFALENSTAASDKDLYSAKLAWLKSRGAQ